ncbi:hypothetical protein NL108_015332 [Boleophthalmus pectinirostris]|nr:hypothetical protein NL108_015332 [Boleophthalmus pectinirostris]
MFLQLLLLLLIPTCTEGMSVGVKFVAAFLENTAYYHPSPVYLSIWTMALHDGTDVTVTTSGSTPYTATAQLNSGQTQVFNITSELELDKSPTASKVVTITGTQNISVEILSSRNNSIQTAVLMPTAQLAQEYHLPPIPEIQRTTVPSIDVTNLVTERSQFRLILVNDDQNNNITLDGKSVNLSPGEVKQLWVDDTMKGKVVSGQAPFLALFGHPCAIQVNCTCGLLFTPLMPSRGVSATFMVPAAFSADVQLLRASSGDRETMSLVTVSDPGPVLLQRPGLLVNLIPVEEFGACFAVHTVADAQNWAVVMAPSNSTAVLHVNADLVSPAPSWSSVGGTSYSWAKIPLDAGGTHVVWSETALIAVWFIGEKTPGTMFGNPAVVLSKTPDFRGCVLVPEQVQVLEEQGSWQESVAACRGQDLDLISLNDPRLQQNIYQKIQEQNQNQNLNLTEMWMGLRKSSYSGAWYWISLDDLQHTDWAYGSPGNDDPEHCARISLVDPQRFAWTHQNCCSQARPVCYRPPKLLTLPTPGAAAAAVKWVGQ